MPTTWSPRAADPSRPAFVAGDTMDRVGQTVEYFSRANKPKGEWIKTISARYEKGPDIEHPRIWVKWHDHSGQTEEYRESQVLSKELAERRLRPFRSPSSSLSPSRNRRSPSPTPTAF